MADLAALLRDFAQGASNSAAGTLTGPVDLAAWLLRKGGLDIKNPVGGSDWMAEQGLMKQPQNYWAGLLGESAGAVLPFAGSKQGVNALLKMQENAAKPATLAKQKGIFAGEWSRTADQAAREKAIELLDAGVPNREVYAKTGWFKGPDGKLRYEIDDSAATLDSTGNFLGRKGGGGTVGQVMDHQPLAAAYPESQNITTQFRFDDANNVSGGYSDFANHITVENPFGPHTSKDLMLHELQHYVQNREGFARGGDPSQFNPYGADRETVSKAWQQAQELHKAKRRAIDDLLVEYRDKPNWQSTLQPELMDKVKALQKQEPMRPTHEAYRRLAGEAEARAVQARMNMTPAERRASFPLDDWGGVPLDQLIFKDGAGLLSKEQINSLLAR